MHFSCNSDEFSLSKFVECLFKCSVYRVLTNEANEWENYVRFATLTSQSDNWKEKTFRQVVFDFYLWNSRSETDRVWITMRFLCRVLDSAPMRHKVQSWIIYKKKCIDCKLCKCRIVFVGRNIFLFYISDAKTCYSIWK